MTDAVTTAASPAQQAGVPRHVAIIMDGNGRWAHRRLMPRVAGHKQGVDTLKRCVNHCMERGIAVLTVFAFSSENWERPADEVSGLLDLLAGALAREVPELQANGVQLHFVGDRTGLSDKVRQGFDKAEASTAHNTRLVLNICFNYGGRWDIAQAAAAVAARGEAITPTSIDRSLALAHVAPPDLLIRTGGEQRVSNFLLWQLAYSELYFCDTLWPDFDAAALDGALGAFVQRERRFGKTSAQVVAESPGRLAA